MKKIKKKLSKRKVTGIPHIGLFLHIELRHSLASFTFEWLQELKVQLAEEITLKLWVSAEEDPELDEILENLNRPEACFERLVVARAQSRGRKLNEGLQQLRADESLDAVIPVAPGDILTPQLLRAYGEHLRAGGLFSGLLDQYLYDPSSLRCMHWSRSEFYEGSKRACELGLMISRPMLDMLKWQLWPSSSDQGLDALHTGVMERMTEVFGMALPKTCLLQSMQAYGVLVVSIKSELGRVLFDEGNWQKLPGLSFADFEITFEEHLGAEWLEKVEEFDERIHLDVLIEAPKAGAHHEAFWKEFYQFIPLKFDPYARVRLHVICDADEAEEIKSWGVEWQPVIINADVKNDDISRWNDGINQLTAQGSEVLLLGGKGSIVDLKTIEHYLIYLFKHGARLMSVSNFFVALSENHQGHFWPGKPDVAFAQLFGFGTCIHRRYLEQLGASPLDHQGGLTVNAQQALDSLLVDKNMKHQRVMFQCAAHKLGVIAFDLEGAVGFTSHIRLADLKPVKISDHLPRPAFTPTLHQTFSLWESGEASSSVRMPQLSSQLSSLSRQLPTSSTPRDQDMSQGQSLSPLERAKALLQQGASSASNSIPQASSVPQQTEKVETLSPLERAKALLKQSQTSSTTPVTEKTTQEVVTNSEPQATLSPLERAKALLKQSQGESGSRVAPPINSPVEAPSSTENAPSQLSPLERAKALLKQSTQPQEIKEVDTTQQAINQALQGAEAMVEHLQKQLEVAKAQEAQETPKTTSTTVSSPADLICQQGEDLYASGDEEKAVKLFESALLVDPSCSRALNNLGVIALSDNAPWRAMSYLLMGLMQDPQNEDITLNLHGLFDLYPDLNTARSVIFD